jgi:hypothetical protein
LNPHAFLYYLILLRHQRFSLANSPDRLCATFSGKNLKR